MSEGWQGVKVVTRVLIVTQTSASYHKYHNDRNVFRVQTRLLPSFIT